MTQFDLFDDVLQCYAQNREMSNPALYDALAHRRNIPKEEFHAQKPIGRSGALHKPVPRAVRWSQQTLRELGLLERDTEHRGVWRLTPRGKKKLTPASPGKKLVAFSTDLGVALWSQAETAFPLLDEPIQLWFTSLPYPLRRPRAYGGPTEANIVDWLCRMAEPIVARMAATGSIVLNVGNDVFLENSPARSLYRERLVIALNDRFGLKKMDEIIWVNPSRPPGPMQWASGTRQQLNYSWEPLYWFAVDPKRTKSDNRRVLQPHTEAHLRLIQGGGEQRVTNYGDGAYRLREGAFSNETAGRIPRNVIVMSHSCPRKRKLGQLARQLGLPVHGATMPLALAELLIEFLTEEGDLVVDSCAGWMTTPRAAQNKKRRWMAAEIMGEYALTGGLDFTTFEGFRAHGMFNLAA